MTMFEYHNFPFRFDSELGFIALRRDENDNCDDENENIYPRLTTTDPVFIVDQGNVRLLMPVVIGECYDIRRY